MPVLAAQSEAAIAVRTDLCAIFVSLELSRSTWLITSLSPGGGEKMSKYSLSAGDIEGLFRRFGDLQERARVRTGQSFAVVTIQEAGLDGFWIHRLLEREGIESWVVDPASILTSRRRRRAKTDGSMARRWCARCWPTSGANRGSALCCTPRHPRTKIAAGSAASARC